MVHRVWTNKKELTGTRTSKEGEEGSKWAPAPRSQKEPSELAPNEVQILVRKVRNKAAGMIGHAVLVYDRPSGRYQDRADVFNMGEEGSTNDKEVISATPSIQPRQDQGSQKGSGLVIVPQDEAFVGLTQGQL